MGLNYDLGEKSENLRRINHLEKFNKANRIFFAVNARFFEYYVRILALKTGDNLIWYGTLCIEEVASGVKDSSIKDRLLWKFILMFWFTK